MPGPTRSRMKTHRASISFTHTIDKYYVLEGATYLRFKTLHTRMLDESKPFRLNERRDLANLLGLLIDQIQDYKGD